MNRSWRMPAGMKGLLKVTAVVLPAGIGLVGLMVPAGAADVRGRVDLADTQPAPKVDFVKDVKPIFESACIKCHSLDPNKPNKKAAAGFQLDDKAAAMKGGRSGKCIIPGNSKDSLLFKLLNGPATVGKDEIAAMPKAKRGEKWAPMPAEKIAVIQQWIDQGAQWPD